MSLLQNPRVKICAVTKGHNIQEVEKLVKKNPKIKIIAENRWPDCREKFEYFKNLEKHFIGPLQTNKINKILPLVDVIQSVDSQELMEKINRAAETLGKKIKFCIQVNVAEDPHKHGIFKEKLNELIEFYLKQNFKNLQLIGLMTIGEQSDFEERRKYFAELKKLFDEVNKRYFSEKISPKISTHPALSVLSMGMSEDYEIAIEEGATMVRLGRALFENKNSEN